MLCPMESASLASIELQQDHVEEDDVLDTTVDHVEEVDTLDTAVDTDEKPQVISEEIVSTSLPPNLMENAVLDIPNTEQTTEGTIKLTGAIKIVQVPVAGQPGRYFTGLLPVLPETDQPEEPASGAATDEAARPSSLAGRAKYLAQRITTLPKQQKIAALSLIVLLILIGSGLLVFSRSHNSTVNTKNVLVRRNVPNVQATLSAQATATVQANNILSDSLSQNIHNWPVEHSGTQQFFFADGTYHILDNDSKQSAPSLLPGIELQEPLTYRLSMEEIKGNDSSINNSFGMILYFTSQSKAGHSVSTFYSFEVVNIKGGQYQFWKYDSSKSTSPWTALWHHPFGGEFHQGEGSKNINTFDVSVRNSVFTFTVNGKDVGSMHDSSFTSGQVGMLVNLNGTEVAFSNMSLTINNQI